MKNNTKRINTKTIAAIGMFCALAFIAMVTIKIPVVLFLKYEPKDVIITLCGFIYGPVSAVAVSLIVSLIEMLTVSETGLIGFFMNVLSTTAFAGTASLIYKKGKSLKSAIIGLFSGVVAMTVVMLLWNFIITPLYMNIPRQQVVNLLVPAFLPFNLIKGAINAALTYLLYRPVVQALRTAKLAPKSTAENGKSTNIAIIICAVVILLTGILMILAFNGVI